MNITIINGSPKGNDLSVTMQYIKYAQKNFPDHNYSLFPVSKDIKKLEKNPDHFDNIMESIAISDAVIFAFPVYYLLVPGQMKRFIELINEKNKADLFANKYVSSISTSIHFYDHSAHNYLNAVCDDWNGSYIKGYSAGMGDLLQTEYRQSFSVFMTQFFRTIENRAPVPKKFNPLTYPKKNLEPPTLADTAKSTAKKLTLLTDHKPGSQLEYMVQIYQASSSYEIEVININDVNIKGGCLGCLTCASEGICVYKDDMRSLFLEKLMHSDAVIFAGTMIDRYLSSRWKTFFDRTFLNGHRPSFIGIKAAFLISGPLRQNANLNEILEAYTQTTGMSLIDIVSDEYEDPQILSGHIKQLAVNTDLSLEHKVSPPENYLGKGGHLVLRDFLYNMTFIFREDHRFYSQYKLYDFPQKDKKAKRNNRLMRILTKIPSVEKQLQKEMKKKMVEPYEKILS